MNLCLGSDEEEEGRQKQQLDWRSERELFYDQFYRTPSFCLTTMFDVTSHKFTSLWEQSSKSSLRVEG